MTKTIIVTDTGADVPKKLAEELGIIVVSMRYKFNGISLDELRKEGYLERLKEKYEKGELDGGTSILTENTNMDAFFEILNKPMVTVKTNAPSKGDWKNAYERALQNADNVVCIPLSKGLSDSYSTACGAAEAFDGKVKVLDANHATYALGVNVVDAAIAARDGQSLDAIVKDTEAGFAKTNFVATVMKTTYLRKSGRIGHLKQGLIHMLHGSKLVISLDEEGKVDGIKPDIAKIIGTKSYVDKMIEYSEDFAKQNDWNPQDLSFFVLNANMPTEAEELKASIETKIVPSSPVEIVQIGPILAGHVNSALGIAAKYQK
ncbi:MAG: DegV family EDD domain-containing protein [bacterium]|nr:DegV family EDD domain-containing protein [bacterium]